MPAAIAIPAIATAVAGGASAAASIYGSHKQAGANKEASRIEASYNDKALAAAEEQTAYDRQQEETKRKRDEEQREYDRRQEADRVAREQERDRYDRRRTEEETTYDRGQYSSYLSRLQPYAASGQVALGRVNAILGGGTGGGALVTMRAPTGETSQVPAAQAAHYEALGAVRV